ncbi:MAG TPA: AAA family ATPase [Albitalea sp.]|nr:AAA family ATPase [Albitalea sp.]
MKRAFVVAIVGAESTGKTTLAGELRDAFAAEGRSVAVVAEHLREWCDQFQRTPLAAEQAQIADEQTRRIDDAAARHEIVIADTTALMTAVYSEMVFGDTSLYAQAALAHRRCDLSLLTALDLPWLADGLQRTGEHVREPVDALVRAALQRAQLPYAVVTGSGPQRLASAMQALRHALQAPSAEHEAAANPRWRWVCERCGDLDCERHLLPPASPG